MMRLLSNIKKKYAKKKLGEYYRDRNVRINLESRFNSDRVGFGQGTAINGLFAIKGAGKCCFGKYCAVGENLNIITSNHDVHYPSLQLTLQRKLIGCMYVKPADVHIGNDVWIGDNVTILPGVNIGNGTVIAAGAVVSKDTPAYSIVGGVPAKVIKNRASAEVALLLNEIQWWDWSEETMRSNKDFFKINIEAESALNSLSGYVTDGLIL